VPKGIEFVEVEAWPEHIHMLVSHRGHYEDTVGRNKNTAAECIENQLQEDIASD